MPKLLDFVGKKVKMRIVGTESVYTVTLNNVESAGVWIAFSELSEVVEPGVRQSYALLNADLFVPFSQIQFLVAHSATH